MVKYRVCVVHLWGQGFISRGILCIHVIDTADEYRTLLRYRVMIVTLCCTCTSAALEGDGGLGVSDRPHGKSQVAIEINWYQYKCL